MAKKLKKRKAAKSIAVKKRVSAQHVKYHLRNQNQKNMSRRKQPYGQPKIPRSRKRTETKLLEKHEHGIREMIDQRKR
jgi:hypothetical protein